MIAHESIRDESAEGGDDLYIPPVNNPNQLAHVAGVGRAPSHARIVAGGERADAGCVWVNCHIPLVAEMPHGGFKESGYGKDLSGYSLEDYTRIKHVMSKYS